MKNTFLIAIKITMLLLIFFYNSELQSQNDIYFTNKTDSIVKIFDDYFTIKIENADGTYKSQLKKFYKRQFEVLTEYSNDSNYINSKEIENRVAEIFKNIVESNPNLQNEKFNVFLDRSFVPNAAVFGDGMMTIYLGLFDFLDNDDEIASVICHELGHHLNKDIENSLNKAFENFYSIEAKNKVKKIKKQRYGQTRAGIELYKELSYDILSYSRDVEFKADEMGFELLKNTKYNPNASAIVLQKFSKLEETIFDEPINIEKVLDFENYKFKTSWITKEQSLFDTDEIIDDFNFDKDSLRTHPFPKDRILNLITKKNVDTLSVNMRADIIKDIKNVNKELLLKSMKDFKEYDYLIYYLLKNNFDNENQMNYNLLGMTLVDVYKSKSKHQLGKGVAIINPFSKEEKLNQIRLFLTQTELYDIANIGYSYAEKYKNKLDEKTYNYIYNYFKPLIK